MTPRRKIGITCYPTYGGSGVVATELGIELAARGHEVHFITSSPPFRLNGREANIRFHEVDVYQYPLFEHPPYDLALATRMAEVAEFYSLDLLHVHYAIPHSLSALLARQMLETQQDAAHRRYLPFITTLHGTDITLVGLDRSFLPITQFGIAQSDGVTAIPATCATAPAKPSTSRARSRWCATSSTAMCMSAFPPRSRPCARASLRPTRSCWSTSPTSARSSAFWTWWRSSRASPGPCPRAC